MIIIYLFYSCKKNPSSIRKKMVESGAATFFVLHFRMAFGIIATLVQTRL